MASADSIKILCTSDLHGSDLLARRIPEICKEENVDLLLCTGDFQDNGYALEFFRKLKTKTFAVPGNWDPGLEFRSENVVCQREGTEEYGGYTFVFGSEKHAEDAGDLLESAGGADPKKLVFLTHYPPEGVLDKLWSGRRVGFKGFREFVDRRKPALHAFGHIHEDNGLKRTADTLFVNAALAERRKAYLVTMPEKEVQTIVI